MLKKKMIIIPSLIIVVLMGSVCAFLLLYDFNKIKPTISRVVKNATGRDLIIMGDIQFTAAWPPTLYAEDITFQNAPWGSSPHMAKAKSLAISISLLPILRGEFRFANLRLVEPEVVLEFSPQGRFNWVFDTGGSSGPATIPVLAFNDIQVRNGWYALRDHKSGLDIRILVDHLQSAIKGLDTPVQLSFKGTFKDLPCEAQGSFGPIMAWIKPGHPLHVDLKAGLGRATANLVGTIENPIAFSGMALTFIAAGQSTREMTSLFGMNEIPEFGDFSIKTVLSGDPDRLAFKRLNAVLGSPQTAQLSLKGAVENLNSLEGIDIDLLVQAESTNALKYTGIPTLPEYGPVRISATLSDPAGNQYRADNIRAAVGEHTLSGSLDLNLAGNKPVLDAAVNSHIPAYGTLTLSSRMSGPIDRIAVDDFELKLEHNQAARAYLAGGISNLNKLEGVDLKLHAFGDELMDLKGLTGGPLPVHGPYTLSAKIDMPDRYSLELPDISIILDKTHLKGSLDLDLSESAPRLSGSFDAGRINFDHLLVPDLFPAHLTRNFTDVGPTHLSFALYDPLGQAALEKITFHTKVRDLAALRLTGSVENLLQRNGVNLHVSVSGDKLQNLEPLVGQTMPFKGPFAWSGNLKNIAEKIYRLDNINTLAGMNTIRGSAGIDFSGSDPVVTVDFNAPGITLQALTFDQDPIVTRLKRVKNLGPLDIKAALIFSDNGIALRNLDISAGTEKLARLGIQGSAGDMLTRRDFDLNLQASGHHISSLAEITGRQFPVRGAYAMSCNLSEHAPGNVMLSELTFSIDENHFNGWINFNLTGDNAIVETELSAEHITLESITHPSVDPLRGISDLGPLELVTKFTWSKKSQAVNHLDLKVGRNETIAAGFRGSIGSLTPLEDIDLDISIESDDLAILKNVHGIEYIDTFPIHAAGHFESAQPGHYNFSDISATYGPSDIAGSVSLNLAGGKPKLAARLSSTHFDLRPILQAFAENNPDFLKQNPAAQRKDRVFSNQSFSTGMLHRMDADIEFQSENMLAYRFAFNDVTLGVHLYDGDLEITPLNFTIGGGSADGKLTLDSENDIPFMKTDLEVHQFDIGPMLEQMGVEKKLEGMLNASIALEGSGDSIAALMAALDGTIYITLDKGRIQNEELAILERYLGSNVLDLLNPFLKKTDNTRINCLITTIEVDKGKADCKLVMDTERSALAVVGTIDLKKESLNIAIKPTPKKGLGEENVGSISFSLSKFSRPFRLGGTLAQPQIILDPARTAVAVGTIAAALSLGPYGVTLLFTDISLGKKNICDETSDEMQPQIVENQEDENK